MGKKIDSHDKELEASRLKMLLEARGVENLAKFARDHKVPGGKAMLNQHLNGERPIAIGAALAYVTGLQCSLAELSPRLANEAKRSAQFISPQNPSAHREHVIVAVEIAALAANLSLGRQLDILHRLREEVEADRQANLQRDE